MGNCLAANPDDNPPHPISGETSTSTQGHARTTSSSRRRRRNELVHQPVAVGKNQPLKNDLPKWKSDVPFTRGQLSSKRDEFWDTAPAFDGRKEIWDALKAAAIACEATDFDLAQAIVNGASISLPHGYLTDCYDELGNRYQLPVYVLSKPTNLQRDDEDNETSSIDQKPESEGEEVTLKLRLSNNKDLKLTVRSTHSVGKIKQILAKSENFGSEQRWFYGGKLLQDKTKVEDIKIPKGHVIQVILPYTENETKLHVPNESPTPVGS